MKALLAVLTLAAMGWVATPTGVSAADADPPAAHAAVPRATEEPARHRQLESHPGWPRWVLEMMEDLTPEAFMHALAR